MEVSVSVIINLTGHTSEFYAVHFCSFFYHLLPLHSTYIRLAFLCLITCAAVYSIVIWPTNWTLLFCVSFGMLCWNSIIFYKTVVSIVALMKISNLTTTHWWMEWWIFRKRRRRRRRRLKVKTMVKEVKEMRKALKQQIHELLLLR